MVHASSGGIANWRGASFELRLAVRMEDQPRRDFFHEVQKRLA
jgi:hypothetical protein